MSSTFKPPLEIVSRRLPYPRRESDIVYPVIVNYPNAAARRTMNAAMLSLTYELIDMQIRQLISQGYKMLRLTMNGWYEIKTNERGILSVTIGNYTIAMPAAHGLTFIKSLTFDISDGKIFALPDLFQPGSDYIGVISAEVARQIEVREIPLLDPQFKAIRADQDYYLSDKVLVVYFQQYEISPYYVGLPMFPISLYDLLPIALPGGPVEVLAGQ